MGCLKGIAQTLLFIANFIIFICAIVFITIGVIYKVNNPGLDIMSVSSYAIAVGVIIGLISFFGCFGACNGSGCLLTTYAVILITIFIAQIVLGILAFIAIKNGEGQLSDEIAKFLDKLYADYSKPDTKKIVDDLQRYLECCGVNKTHTSGDWTASCCSKDDEPCTLNNRYSQSCSSRLEDFIDDNAKIIGGVAIGFGIFELVAAGLACCVRKRNTGRYY